MTPDWTRCAVVFSVILVMTGCGVRPAEPGDRPWSTRDDSRPGAFTADATSAGNGGNSAAAESVGPPRSDRAAPLASAQFEVSERVTRERRGAPRRDRAIAPPEVLRAQAIDLLRRASESSNDQLRVHAIEAAQFAPEVLPEVVRAGLGDANRGVRFAAAMMVGKYELTAVARYVEPLVHDASESVRAAAIFALHRTGRPVSLDPLSAMLASSDPEVKGNAVMVLGELGNPSAIPMLREAMRSPSRRLSANRQRIIELQIAEAMVRLGDESPLDIIRAALFAPSEQGEFSAMASTIAGRLGDEAYSQALHDIAIREGRDARPAEVRLAAALALAEMMSDRAPVQVPLAFTSNSNVLVRAQAAWTLGAFPVPVAGSVLAELLQDANPLVQVSAAGGLLRWLSMAEG